MTQTIDAHKDIRNLQLFHIPKDHPRPDAQVPQGEVRSVVHQRIQFGTFVGFVRRELVETVEPGELEDLLHGEECADEVGVRGPEGDVAVVDVFHAGGGEDAVLLGGEVEGPGCGGLVVFC